jgi:hypothetical protein
MIGLKKVMESPTVDHLCQKIVEVVAVGGMSLQRAWQANTTALR